MNELNYWQLKLIQALHDPPTKPYAMIPGQGGQKALSNRLYEALVAKNINYFLTRPDRAASGADRPVVQPQRGEGVRPINQFFHRQGENLILHPLAKGFSFEASDSQGLVPRSGDDIRRAMEMEVDALAALAAVDSPDWANTKSLHEAFLRLWRRYREEVVGADGGPERGSLLWEQMPADTRCPDHSIWDHLRVTSALAFMSQTMAKPVPDTQQPWLFIFSLGSVQGFIEKSRTPRDLWTSSFLLSELAFHAMLPIIKRYGPDQIVYPDLRANPRVDRWLKDTYPDALPEYIKDPTTYAAVVPNTFVALLPQGAQGEEFLRGVDQIGHDCQRAMESRWLELAELVRPWLRERGGSGKWEELWTAQHREVLHCYWTAVPWLLPEPMNEMPIGGVFPGQDQSRVTASDDPNVKARRDRYQRLAAWVPDEVWNHYEATRDVFWKTNKRFLQDERGFDYALTHHQLRVRQGLRKNSYPYPKEDRAGSGEKCTLCGEREALWNPEPIEPTAGQAEMDLQRDKVKLFWGKIELSLNGANQGDAGERGAERLCAVCAFKRCLVEISDPDGINSIWAGSHAEEQGVLAKGSSEKLRLPFPSTTLLAGQEYVEKVLESEALVPSIRKLVSACDYERRPKNNYVWSLARFAAVQPGSLKESFLRLDIQDVLFPQNLRAELYKNRENGAEYEKLKSVVQAAEQLREEADRLLSQKPQTRFAVLRLDGDSMGQLLLGDAERIATSWEDVLHPKFLEELRKHPQLIDAGWLDLLKAKRLMGPALHAFVSRALGEFSHRIVPWVVEQEYGGRLIYSGGDDVLALAPANEAPAIAARLQQLFSAAWVIDTDYEPDAWKWRRPGANHNWNPEVARRRFVIAKQPRAGESLRLPLVPDQQESHISGIEPDRAVTGPVFPMLGPGQSVSAGVVCAHFKTHLGRMLKHSKSLLDDVAKDGNGRSSLGLAHYSRNGIKTEFALHWKLDESLGAHRALERVIGAFATGALPGRLPYKLRERARVFANVSSPTEQRDLMKGFLRQCLDGNALDLEIEQSVLAMWKAGITLCTEMGREPERSVDGLLFCRAMSQPDEEEP